MVSSFISTSSTCDLYPVNANGGCSLFCRTTWKADISDPLGLEQLPWPTNDLLVSHLKLLSFPPDLCQVLFSSISGSSSHFSSSSSSSSSGSSSIFIFAPTTPNRSPNVPAVGWSIMAGPMIYFCAVPTCCFSSSSFLPSCSSSCGSFYPSLAASLFKKSK